MLAMTNQGFQIGLVAFALECGRDSTKVNQWASLRALKPAQKNPPPWLGDGFFSRLNCRDNANEHYYCWN